MKKKVEKDGGILYNYKQIEDVKGEIRKTKD